MRKIGERRIGKVLFAFLQPKSILEKKMMANHRIAKNRFLNTISIYLISFCKNLEVNKYGENIGIFVWSKTWDSLPLNGRASAEKCKYCSTTLGMRKLLPSIFLFGILWYAQNNPLSLTRVIKYTLLHIDIFFTLNLNLNVVEIYIRSQFFGM